MPCTSPVRMYRVSALHPSTGNRLCIWVAAYKPALHGQIIHEFERPCQYCTDCRLRRSRDTAIRCVHTASLHDLNCSVTLSYSDDNLPHDLSLSTDVLQKFWKKLRHLTGPNLKYYASGEYGDGKGERPINPHYHACLFGYDFPDKRYFKKSPSGLPLYQSDLLDKTWGLGHALLGDVTFESAAYCARYVMKKIFGDKADAHYDGRLPEKSWSSTGLGKDWLALNYKDVYPSDEIYTRDGRRLRPPPYYDLLMQKWFPDAFADVEHERAKKIIIQKNNFTLEHSWENGIPKTRTVSDVVQRALLRVGSIDKDR